MNKEFLEKMADAVVEMDDDLVQELSQQVIDERHDAFEAIDQGLSKGMERAGQLFEEEEYFVPELLMCAETMGIGIDILKPYIKTDSVTRKHKIVIGVIEGDTHDIGKNLVKLMLESSNFDVVDLGRDVPAVTFVDRAVEEKAEMIMISSLMTTTMDAMANVVTILKDRGIKENYLVAVGGGPVSQGFANKIGADGYSNNAADAVKLCNTLLN